MICESENGKGMGDLGVHSDHSPRHRCGHSRPRSRSETEQGERLPYRVSREIRSMMCFPYRLLTRYTRRNTFLSGS